MALTALPPPLADLSDATPAPGERRGWPRWLPVPPDDRRGQAVVRYPAPATLAPRLDRLEAELGEQGGLRWASTAWRVRHRDVLPAEELLDRVYRCCAWTSQRHRTTPAPAGCRD